MMPIHPAMTRKPQVRATVQEKVWSIWVNIWLSVWYAAPSTAFDTGFGG